MNMFSYQECELNASFSETLNSHHTQEVGGERVR